jgi:hypothetical protein
MLALVIESIFFTNTFEKSARKLLLLESLRLVSVKMINIPKKLQNIPGEKFMQAMFKWWGKSIALCLDQKSVVHDLTNLFVNLPK